MYRSFLSFQGGVYRATVSFASVLRQFCVSFRISGTFGKISLFKGNFEGFLPESAYAEGSKLSEGKSGQDFEEGQTMLARLRGDQEIAGGSEVTCSPECGPEEE
jgi:hypothetical protein